MWQDNETRENSWYDTAQICLNGHIINDSVTLYPKRKQDFCDKCGDKTIMFCQNCNANIRGDYHVPGVGSLGLTYTPPGYCYSCGKPYPWTASALEAAKELAKEVEGLTPAEQELLSQSIDEIVKNGPKTVVATTRFKKLATKFGSGIGNAFREILVDVVSESVKKSLWP
ncbi:hypothetical protein B5P41_26760 [Bacillus sp. SRB_28]|nr:hypothetical protein B5P41_26760 [Bacillus sp. SRB_28]